MRIFVTTCLSGELPRAICDTERILTAARLHNEIMDFYDHVRPNQHEHNVRLNLIKRIEQALGTRHFPSSIGHVLCFGSYPAGLYLPTADMDLVYVTDHYKDYEEPAFNPDHKRQVADTLFSASRKLRNRGVAVDVTVIHRAKVPIIKFVDSVTGIKVDLSFENLSGIEAQATYQKWKEEYPDMVYLVALVKQFLAMRGLNDVHTGGLGGFSIICLCVSYMQLLPKPENLGNLFLGFLDYYGHNFNLARKRIVMDPAALVEKVCTTSLRLW
jgi:non-canonical poly(A) RNA polymerase PAPD5/7